MKSIQGLGVYQPTCEELLDDLIYEYGVIPELKSGAEIKTRVLLMEEAVDRPFTSTARSRRPPVHVVEQ